MSNSRNLQGSVALVTGGAGGIGTAICEALALEGASVIVGFNNSSDTANALVKKLPCYDGAKHCALKASVTDSAKLDDLAAAIRVEYGKCDIVVNESTRIC